MNNSKSIERFASASVAASASRDDSPRGTCSSHVESQHVAIGLQVNGHDRPALRRTHRRVRARRARQRRRPRRWADDRAQQLREPRLPALARRRAAGRRKVLSTLALERRRDPRRACADRRARRARGSGRTADGHRRAHAPSFRRFPVFDLRAAWWPRPGARTARNARAPRPVHRPDAHRRRSAAVRASSRADDRIVRRRVARIPARARVRSRRYSCRLDEHRRPGAAGRSPRLRRSSGAG